MLSTARLSIRIAGAGAAFVEALMALHSRLVGRVGIELLAPAQGFAYRPIALAERVGLVEGWRVTLARIAADAG
ncbi:MAG: hypothetical protein ACXVR2_03750, partial [Solirubrobacteraceae bacterium]